MRLNLTQENLNKGLQVVGRAVGSRTTLPVLTNVLLKTDKNQLKLASTNLEIGVNYWVSAKVEEAGAITVPARLLSDFINTLPSGLNIELSLDKHTLKIKAGKYESSINGIDSEEFPSIPAVSGGVGFEIGGLELGEAIEQVARVAATDDARPVLGGVYIKNTKGELVIAATDSYRLAEKKIQLKDKKTADFSAIVPAKTLQELLRIMDGTKEAVSVQIDENQALFKVGGAELVSRLIDGEFPKYESLIPDKTTTTFKIARSEFIAIAKVANLFARESAGSVALKTDKNGVTLSSIASQVGENTSTAEASVKGEAAEVSLNCRYLLDGLEATAAEEITFGITGKINPCVIRPAGESDYLHIIMPLRS